MPRHIIATGNQAISGNLTISGSLISTQAPLFPFLGITGATTLDSSHSTVECTANSFDVTLPTAVGISGKTYKVKNTGGGYISVVTTSSQTIDGYSSITLGPFDSMDFMSNGSNWIIN